VKTARISNGTIRVKSRVKSTAPDYHLVGVVDRITRRAGYDGGVAIWVSWAGMNPVMMQARELRTL
jgi:hypothetical protein